MSPSLQTMSSLRPPSTQWGFITLSLARGSFFTLLQKWPGAELMFRKHLAPNKRSRTEMMRRSRCQISGLEGWLIRGQLSIRMRTPALPLSARPMLPFLSGKLITRCRWSKREQRRRREHPSPPALCSLGPSVNPLTRPSFRCSSRASNGVVTTR